MYFPDTQLSGLGKKSRFKKRIKRHIKRLVKIAKKLAPVAVAVYGGAVGAKLYASYAAKRKAAGASDAQIEAETTMLSKRGISPEQADYQPAVQQRAMVSSPPGAADVSAPIRDEAELPAPKPAMPGWLLPAAIAAGVAFFALK